MEEEYAKELLKNTRDDYNLIAEHFSRTRSFLPEDIKKLGEYPFPGEKVLDLGCGNGRFIDALKNKDVDYFGIDISEKLIELAKTKHPKAKFLVGDSLNLPFPANFFGAIFSISVLHHIPSNNFRFEFLKEAKRVLRPEGNLVLKVWDFWREISGLKLIFKYGLLQFIGKEKLDFGDVFVPWKNPKGEILAERYIHCFRKTELENLVKAAGFKIKESWREGRGEFSNIYLRAEK